MIATAHMPLLERLRKGANCVGFLDGAPEPAEDVADMLRKAADKIERQHKLLSLICRTDRNHEVFDCPSGGAIRIELQSLLNE